MLDWGTRHMKPLAIRLVSVLCVFALGICIVLSSSPAARAAGDISGTVTNQLGQPASSIFVDAYEASTGDWIDSASTDENGTYTMAALVDGHDYKLHFTDQNASYAMEWYSDAPTFQAAAGVTAPAAGIDAQLGPGVEISGTVIEAGTGTPVENCTACLYDPTMNPRRYKVLRISFKVEGGLLEHGWDFRKASWSEKTHVGVCVVSAYMQTPCRHHADTS